MTAPPPPQPCACRCCSRPTVPSRSRVARSSLASSNSGVVASAAAVEVKPQQHSIQRCWLCCISAPGRQAHQTRPEKLRTKDKAAAGRNLLRSKRSRRLTIDDGALFRSWVVIRRFFWTNLCGPAVGPHFVNRAQTRGADEPAHREVSIGTTCGYHPRGNRGHRAEVAIAGSRPVRTGAELQPYGIEGRNGADQR